MALSAGNSDNARDPGFILPRTSLRVTRADPKTQENAEATPVRTSVDADCGPKRRLSVADTTDKRPFPR